MSFELSQLIDRCLKDKPEQPTLPKLPKIVSSDALKITFEPSDRNASVNEIDLLTRFPVMETGYMTAKLVELNLLNGAENGEDQDKLERSLSGRSDGQIGDDTRGKPKVKRNIYEAWLEFETNEPLEFHPGDSIGISIGNFDTEVDEFIKLLGLNEKKEQLLIIENGSALSLPARSTLRLLIKYCVEIRAIPKKVALLHFSQFCSDSNERDCLAFLSSKEGSKLYDEFILKPHFGFLDLLKCFSSCKPDLRAFLVHSINFVPRYYSVIEHETKPAESNRETGVSSSAIIDEKPIANRKSICRVKLAFDVMLLPPVYNRSSTQLFGVFTGQIEQHFRAQIKGLPTGKSDQQADLNGMMNKLSIGDEPPSLYVFKRKNTMFRLSYDPLNIIMISIGTGLTPFLSLFKANSEHNRQVLTEQMVRPNYYLVHGCRTEKDCLYLGELRSFESKKFFKDFKLCISREKRPGNPPHVQDYLKSIQNELRMLLLDEQQNTVVYVCGDQIKFPKDVFGTLAEILDVTNADKMLREMQKSGKYLQDVW